jgi:hypothetical protein
VADYYRDLAADYDWLYDDDALTDGFAITRPAVADLLQRVGPEYRIPLLPVTLGELRERLELARLREVGTDFGETTDQYIVIAVAA